MAKKSLEKLSKARIDNLNMKTHHTITDYMVAEKYITENDFLTVYREIARLESDMKKDSVIFEIACFNIGLISELDLINIITNFRGLEVVSKAELELMDMSFTSFSYELCKKHLFFEVDNHSSSKVKQMVVSFTSAERIGNLLKRSIADFRLRYSLPSYIEEKLKNQY